MRCGGCVVGCAPRIRPTAGPTADLVAAALLGAPAARRPAGRPARTGRRRPVDHWRPCRSVADEPDPRVPLWRVWQRLGLAEDLLAASLRGGRAGRAGRPEPGRRARTVRRRRRAGRPAALRRDPGVPGPRPRTDGSPTDPTSARGRAAQGVVLLSAHAAKGLEWDVVCLAGVSEGRWPVLRRTQSLLGLDELLDADEGIARRWRVRRAARSIRCRRSVGCSTWPRPGPGGGWSPPRCPTRTRCPAGS